MKSGPTKREKIIVGVLSPCQKVGLLFRTPKLRHFFFKMIFLVFGAFHFPFKIPLNKTSKSYFFPALTPRSGFGAGFGPGKS
jgi:hypothetical protein